MFITRSKTAFCGLSALMFIGLTVMDVAAQIIDPDKIPFADGFDLPVGKPDGEGYYLSRGIRGRHLGEDWNGVGGGNTDLGDPVYSVAHGLVISASDLKMGYGKTVFVVHKFMENGKIRMVETLYAHLHQITVSRGDVVRRGQKVGTIGTGNGLYTAHLHFELRDKPGQFVRIGYRKGREAFLDPFRFIAARRPPGATELMLVQRPGKFPGRIPLSRGKTVSRSRFLAENRNVPAPRAGARPVSIDIATPEDGRIASIRKSVTSTIPKLTNVGRGEKAVNANDTEVKVAGGSGSKGAPKIETTHLADEVTEKRIAYELGNLPEDVSKKFAKAKEKKGEVVDHFVQHMSNDALDDPEMSEAALKAERLMIAEALANRSKKGGVAGGES
ncbi:M23 family metallopeptidase [Oscillatoria amoena NRMC-F 0135]|nr:M23 family metallopeptidase [Oscillatoria amoena NRMC-F 0135]